MNPVEQTLLYLASIVVLAGTLTVFVVQYFRGRRRGGSGGAGGSSSGGSGETGGDGSGASGGSGDRDDR